MTKTIDDLSRLIDQILPFSIQEDWDNSGLQVGNPEDRLKNIVVCLDVENEVIEFALEKGSNLVISHHPLLFYPVKRIDLSSPSGKVLERLIAKKLSVLSLHTNLDKGLFSIFSLIKELGIKKCRPVMPEISSRMYKLAVFVPSGYAENIKDAIFPVINKASLLYTDVSFSTKGTGTFKPSEKSAPFRGNAGIMEFVNEERIEFLIDSDKLEEAIKTIRKVHPYQEPAFDIYPLKSESLSSSFGFGLFGEVEIKGLSLREVEKILKEKLKVRTIRKIGDAVKVVKSIAICPGSGASLIEEVAKLAPSIYITGDLKYHDAKKAEELGLIVYDVGHFSLENLMMKDFSTHLDSILKKFNFSSTVYFFDKSKDIFINC